MTCAKRCPANILYTYSLVILCVYFLLYAKNAEAACDPLSPTYFKCLYDELKVQYDNLKNTIVPALRNEVSNLEGKVQSLTGQITAPLTIAENLAQIINQGDLDSLGVDASMMVQFSEAIRFAYEQNNLILTEYEAFAADADCIGVCAEFRTRLGHLIKGIANVANLANEVLARQASLVSPMMPVPVVLNINGEELADFIEHAPPSVLFPLYYALKAMSENMDTPDGPPDSECTDSYCEFLSPVAGMVADINEELLALRNNLISLSENSGITRDPLCSTLMNNGQLYNAVSLSSSIIAPLAKLIYEIGNFLAQPKMSVTPKGNSIGASFAVGGEVEVEVDLAKPFGVKMRLLSNPVRLIAEGVDMMVNDCRQRLEQYLAICALANDVKKNDSFAECKNKVLFSNERFGF